MDLKQFQFVQTFKTSQENNSKNNLNFPQTLKTAQENLTPLKYPKLPQTLKETQENPNLKSNFRLTKP
jgi:hypothetical protein